MNPPPNNDALVAKLITAPTQNARINDLKDKDFVFDFVNSPHGAQGQDGFITIINPANFPALLTGNGALGVGMIGPCGLNTPHVHPRASEIQINVGGGSLMAEFILENGARVVQNTLRPGTATVYPKGSIHFQQNLGCEPVTFIASFDYVDPGVSQLANNLIQLDKEVLSATFNDVGLKFLDDLVIPPNIILGAESCFKRCKIDRGHFKFNGTFADFFDATKHLNTLSSNPYQAMTSSNSNPNTMAGMLSQSHRSTSDIPVSQNPLWSTVMGLSGTLVFVIIFAIFAVLRSKRRQSRSKTAQYLAAVDADMIESYRDAVKSTEKA